MIVGKWKATSGSLGENLPRGRQALVVWEFAADGSYTSTTTMSEGHQSETFVKRGSYRLGGGKTVFLENLDPPEDGRNSSMESMLVVGNELKVEFGDGRVGRFRRVTDE